jgi:hypothetical protein
MAVCGQQLADFDLVPVAVNSVAALVLESLLAFAVKYP